MSDIFLPGPVFSFFFSGMANSIHQQLDLLTLAVAGTVRAVGDPFGHLAGTADEADQRRGLSHHGRHLPNHDRAKAQSKGENRVPL